MEANTEYKTTPKELLMRYGLTEYEAEKTKITAIELAEDGIKIQTQRTIMRFPSVRHEPKPAKS